MHNMDSISRRLVISFSSWPAIRFIGWWERFQKMYEANDNPSGFLPMEENSELIVRVIGCLNHVVEECLINVWGILYSTVQSITRVNNIKNTRKCRHVSSSNFWNNSPGAKCKAWANQLHDSLLSLLLRAQMISEKPTPKTNPENHHSHSISLMMWT